MQTILDLYDQPPADGRVVCVDEFGPLNLQPRKGKCWRPAIYPRRQRATYHRYDGVMHMLAVLDLASGRMHYRIRPRKRSGEFLDLLKTLRARWPGEKHDPARFPTMVSRRMSMTSSARIRNGSTARIFRSCSSTPNPVTSSTTTPEISSAVGRIRPR